jgi:hypothetical protein
MKNTKLVKNTAGGYDLLTERDSGNPVRILLGKKESSLKFFKFLRDLCETAIDLLENE